MDIKYILFVIILFLFQMIYKNKKNKKNKNSIEKFYNQYEPNLLDNYKIDFMAARELINISRKLIRNGITLPANVDIRKNALDIFPKGFIVAYDKMIAPEGWAICDGNSGTPDLRGRFIRMWNDNITTFALNNLTEVGNKAAYDDKYKSSAENTNKSYILKHKVNNYGGSDMRNFTDMNELPTHTHTLNNAGEHSHTISLSYWDNGYYPNRFDEQPYTELGGSLFGPKNLTGHSHKHTISSIGNSEQFNNQPPYYVVTYIMKL